LLWVSGFALVHGPPPRLIQTDSEGAAVRKASLLASSALTGLALAFPAAAQTPVYSWTGFYIGLNAGYGWGDNGTSCSFDASFVFASGDPASVCNGFAFPGVSPSGIIGGVQIGNNWQSGNFVFGLEADFSGSGIRGTSQFPSVDQGKTDEVSSRYDWLGTVRGRGGIAAGPGFYYATGGLAYGQVRNKYIFDITGENGCCPPTDRVEFSSSGARFGWTAGAGAEFMWRTNWSIKIEYLFVDLGTTDVDISNHPLHVDTGFNSVPSTLHFNNQLNIVRGGVNYRFGP
jgi:outer membrane immunogenic protein